MADQFQSYTMGASAGNRATGAPSSHQSHDQRMRSMSLSNLLRNHKHAVFSHDDPHPPRQTHEVAIDDSEDTHELPSRKRRVRAQSTAGTIKGVIRRASLSLKGMVHVHRRPSITAEPSEFNNQPVSHARPTSAHHTWNRLRHAAPFRRSRSFYGFNVTDDGLYEQQQNPHMPIPAMGDEPPYIPMNTGAAAKASVALQNEYYTRQAMHTQWLQSSSEDSNDRESGIGIVVTQPFIESGLSDDGSILAQDSNISRVDFIKQLPSELAIHVLACLDAAALAKASVVSRHWNEVVRNQHIWRESCLREMTTTYATSEPVKPGAGLGIPEVVPTNDWKQIYRAKLELAQKWKEGKARPMYLNGHMDSIYCLQFDEYKIISGSRDKTIRIWDMQTLECRLVIGPPEVVNHPMMLEDAEGNPTHYVNFSDSYRASPSMPKVASFDEHHKASILCLQYDEEIMVTGSSDSTCIVYDMRNGYRPIRRLTHHTAAVLDLAFDEKHIVTCSKDISICVWDRATGNLLRQLRGHTGPVNAVQMRGNTIVSCSGDFRVKLWNIDTGRNIREFVGHTKGLACSQFSEDGRYVASAGNDKVIRIWDANTGECVREMRAHENLVRSLHIDSVSGRLVSGSYDTDIKVWDMETGRQLLDFPRWHASWVLSAKSDYRRIVSTGQDPKILIMDFGAEVEGIDMLNSANTGIGGNIF
ncbi:WD domain, g-beta repeat domain-containing protein [Trichoderma breve]|uniref:WD domain, g-beta repeat domain-containing protein n=1 Tax=Trichoderma breve TaxID=2034170 RepID=A0A9W9BCJ9_9HYPO|nr:WD domain, g-beta repeat domain-containing protein [Trichoderma breve]KAJ4860757.1 WD domain, g-beta repeat domain-containing protein [Trichoderma breve]